MEEKTFNYARHRTCRKPAKNMKAGYIIYLDATTTGNEQGGEQIMELADVSVRNSGEVYLKPKGDKVFAVPGMQIVKVLEYYSMKGLTSPTGKVVDDLESVYELVAQVTGVPENEIYEDSSLAADFNINDDQITQLIDGGQAWYQVRMDNELKLLKEGEDFTIKEIQEIIARLRNAKLRH